MNAECQENNTLLDFDRLLTAVSGLPLVPEGHSGATFTSVVTDSRKVVRGSLFVPLIGEFHDGHDYIPQAIKRGASIVFVAKEEYNRDHELYKSFINKNGISCIVVQNTLAALQNAAAAYVDKFPRLIKVGITGSSGKTTTKELAVSILAQKYRVIYNEGNLNSETGLPLSVFRIRSDSQVGIFEMGMNRHDEIGEIAAVLRPQYAVITNIGTAHIGILGSRENIAAEKKKIFSYINASGAAIIPAADDFADFLASGVQGRVIRYGPNEPESGVAYVADKGFEGSLLKVDGEPVLLRLPGKYNYLNVLAAIALARCLDVTGAEIRSGIRMMAPLAGRGQISHVRLPPESGSSTVRTVTLFEDCYNANPDSLSKTLELCASVRNRKIYVLGDMLELGSVAVAAHAEAGVRAAESEKNTGGMLIFVGREMKTAAESAAKAGADRILYFPGCDDASIEKVVQSILDFTRDGDFILLKGSRGIGLERISGIIKGGSCG